MTASSAIVQRIRSAVADCREPFSTKDVLAATGMSEQSDYATVYDALRALEDLGELSSELVGKRPAIGEGRPKRKVYRRTRTFRTGEVNPLAQIEGGRLINQLACRWTQRRHASA